MWRAKTMSDYVDIPYLKRLLAEARESEGKWDEKSFAARRVFATTLDGVAWALIRAYEERDALLKEKLRESWRSF